MTKEYSWMLGPFEKAAEANPCLVPNAVSIGKGAKIGPNAMVNKNVEDGEEQW